MANPGRPKIILQTASRDDRINAGKPANLGMLGMVPQAYACTGEAWDRRQLLRQRAALVRDKLCQRATKQTRSGGGILQIWSSNNEQGHSIRTCSDTSRQMVDFDLVRVP